LENSHIRIEHIKLKDLSDFARKALSHPDFHSVTPISLIRAQAQSMNPHAQPDDVALLVAFYKNRCVAYHGLLPGLLKGNGNFSKIYWLVTFFVSPHYRKKGIGKLLVKEIQRLGIDLVTTGITKGAEAVYRSMGFKPLGELAFVQLRLDRLPFPGAFFRNLLQYLEEKRFSYRQVPYLSERFQSAADDKPGPPLFFRGIKAINWMLQHRWVVSRHEEKGGTENYFFSTVRDLFKYIALEIYSADEKSAKGFIVYSVSCKKNKTSVKILDYHFSDPSDNHIAAYFGLKYAKEFLADRIEFPEHLAGSFINRLSLPKLMKKKKRLYLFCPSSDDSPLAISAQKITLDYCDSDTAFT
jgi:GNAT superfamily N-acetyltransferase